MPCALAAHRKTAEHDALVIDIETLLHRCDGLEDIRFSGPVPAGAIDAAEAIELNLALIGHRRVPRRPGVQKVENELRFGRIVLPAVQPHVQAGWPGGIVIRRQRDAVRLNRAIDFGIVCMDLFLALIPLRLAALQLLGALNALIEDKE